MPIPWSDQTARWLEAASEYTGFHARMADRLLPHISQRGSLLDLGCGTGLIDLALAAYIGTITCVDNDIAPLRHLEAMAEARGIRNIETRCMDASSVTGLWDTVLLMFYGRSDEDFLRALSCCREQVIAVVHARPHGSDRETSQTERLQASLDERNIPYELDEISLEYGQPLTSEDDFVDYRQVYAKDTASPLIETGDPKYPYYLPKRKELGIFYIQPQGDLHR